MYAVPDVINRNPPQDGCRTYNDSAGRWERLQTTNDRAPMTRLAGKKE